jgi:hypothetical protein
MGWTWRVGTDVNEYGDERWVRYALGCKLCVDCVTQMHVRVASFIRGQQCSKSSDSTYCGARLEFDTYWQYHRVYKSDEKVVV